MWSFGFRSKKELINHLRKSAFGMEATDIQLVGNHLWLLVEDYRAEPEIILCILGKAGGLWGYKPMDEACGPGVLSCPLRFLDVAPVKNAEWRSAVREYHEHKRREAEVLVDIEKIKYGTLITLKEGYRPSKLFVTQVSRPAQEVLAMADGRTYRVPVKAIAEAV